MIQQNASASEEMASTSEELNSQAEQMQETVAFFRVDGGSGPVRGKALPSETQTAKGQPLAIGHSSSKTGKKPGEPAKAAARRTGVELNMNDSGDRLDEEFERF